MKKVFALITALACCFSLWVLPAAAEESTDLLEQKLKETLDPLDNHYDYYGSYLPEMIRQANLVIYEKYDPENQENYVDVSAEEYEKVLNQFFVPTAEDMAFIQKNEPYINEPGVGNARPLEYNPETDTYRVSYPYWDPLPNNREYLGYVVTSKGFDVYYGKAHYCYLSDALPEGTKEYEYVGPLNYPDTLEYNGKLYQKSVHGYYYVDSMEQNGMKYSVKLDGENVRIFGAQPFTEEECPDSFETLPEVDDDLLSIMEDIQDLVYKYAPEIPDEVKNGTSKGTKCQYKPTENAYYVAIGDDTAAATNSYVKLFAESLKISYKNLAKNGMLIDHANAAFLEANAAEIQKADLITIGFSVNGFAAVAVEEVLKNKSDEESYIQWSRYLPEEGVQEIENVLDRLHQYLIDNGLTGNIYAGISKSDALVTAAESLAFGTLAFIKELPSLVDEIQTINPNAQIIIVGMDNPMQNSSIVLTTGEKMELGVYLDQLIDNMDKAAQTVAIEKNTTFASAPDALNENDNQELSENALLLSYINGVKNRAKPNGEGQKYIRNQIIKTMRRKGDANGDGMVSYNDALLVLRASIGLETISEEDMLFADVDGKPGISYNDALLILRASIGLEELEEEEFHEHEWIDATCTEPKKCKTCGETEGTAKDHDWQKATCTAPKTCKACAATEGTAAGHDWQEATCTAPKTCKACAATEGTAKDHDWQEATCTAPKTCKACATTEGTAAGHDWQEATCTAPKTCKACAATEGTAAGHDWQEATCTAPKTCKVCAATEGTALGHKFENGVCTSCGAGFSLTMEQDLPMQMVCKWSDSEANVEFSKMTYATVANEDGTMDLQITLTVCILERNTEKDTYLDFWVELSGFGKKVGGFIGKIGQNKSVTVTFKNVPIGSYQLSVSEDK